ncbi:hypothetical protein CCMA1212_009442 [Trichoderma ghanense]|uniref:Uncharacterized protein n=1 Tax=Trichoderma ghanense TaxID=65468 RepID=A0ABY2GS99_9HYPO
MQKRTEEKYLGEILPHLTLVPLLHKAFELPQHKQKEEVGGSTGTDSGPGSGHTRTLTLTLTLTQILPLRGVANFRSQSPRAAKDPEQHRTAHESENPPIGYKLQGDGRGSSVPCTAAVPAPVSVPGRGPAPLLPLLEAMLPPMPDGCVAAPRSRSTTPTRRTWQLVTAIGGPPEMGWDGMGWMASMEGSTAWLHGSQALPPTWPWSTTVSGSVALVLGEPEHLAAGNPIAISAANWSDWSRATSASAHFEGQRQGAYRCHIDVIGASTRSAASMAVRATYLVRQADGFAAAPSHLDMRCTAASRFADAMPPDARAVPGGNETKDERCMEWAATMLCPCAILPKDPCLIRPTDGLAHCSLGVESQRGPWVAPKTPNTPKTRRPGDPGRRLGGSDALVLRIIDGKFYRTWTSRDSVLSPCRLVTRTLKLGAEPTTEQGTDQEGRPAQAPTGSELGRWRDGLKTVPALWSFGALRGRQKHGNDQAPVDSQCQVSTGTGTRWNACSEEGQQLEDDIRETQQQQQQNKRQSSSVATPHWIGGLFRAALTTDIDRKSSRDGYGADVPSGCEMLPQGRATSSRTCQGRHAPTVPGIVQVPEVAGAGTATVASVGWKLAQIPSVLPLLPNFLRKSQIPSVCRVHAGDGAEAGGLLQVTSGSGPVATIISFSSAY